MLGDKAKPMKVKVVLCCVVALKYFLGSCFAH